MERCGFKELHRAFRITRQGVYLSGKSKFSRTYSKGNQNPAACKGRGMKMPQSLGYDPKPGDLVLGKVKPTIRLVEA